MFLPDYAQLLIVALPYWNYSEDLSKNPKARLMPPDFFDKTIDGKANALFSRRSRASNGTFGLDASVVTLKALTMRNFANSVPGRPSGFGGPVTGFNPGGGDNGGLENLPHNAVHGQIGGFMNDPRTAALAEIAWSQPSHIDWDSFERRLEAQLPRYATLGISYARETPVVPGPRRRPGHRSAGRSGAPDWS